MALHIIKQDRTPYPILVDMILLLIFLIVLALLTQPLSDVRDLAQHTVLMRPSALIPTVTARKPVPFRNGSKLFGTRIQIGLRPPGPVVSLTFLLYFWSTPIHDQSLHKTLYF